VLNASNGRIVLAPADIKSRLALLRSPNGFRAHGIAASIATTVLPRVPVPSSRLLFRREKQ
jgi:hypothetical protein